MLPLLLQLVWALFFLFCAVGVCAALHTVARADAAHFFCSWCGRYVAFLLRLAYVLYFLLLLGWMMPLIMRSIWTSPCHYNAVGACAVVYTAVKVDAALFSAVGVDADLICCN